MTEAKLLPVLLGNSPDDRTVYVVGGLDSDGERNGIDPRSSEAVIGIWGDVRDGVVVELPAVERVPGHEDLWREAGNDSSPLVGDRSVDLSITRGLIALAAKAQQQAKATTLTPEQALHEVLNAADDTGLVTKQSARVREALASGEIRMSTP